LDLPLIAPDSLPPATGRWARSALLSPRPARSMRRVLHVIETMAAHEGGPPRVVAGLAIAQRAMGIEAHILCGDGRSLPDHLQYWLAHAAGFPAESVHAPAGRTASLPARAPALR